MFDSYDNAVRTLANIRKMGTTMQQPWKAQLYPATTSMSLSEPSPTLVIRLGIRGTLEDAKRLFCDYDGGLEGQPLDVSLGKSRNCSSKPNL